MMDKSPESPTPEGIVEKTERQLRDEFYESPHFGACLMTTILPSGYKKYPILTLVTQYILIIALAIDKIPEFEESEYCPDAAPSSARLIMIAAALYYLSKCVLDFEVSYKNGAYVDSRLNKYLPSSYPDQYVEFIGQYDCFVNKNIFETLVHVFNLMLLFRTDEPLDMVLNLVALDFIVNIDDEVNVQLVKFIGEEEFFIALEKSLKNSASIQDSGAARVLFFIPFLILRVCAAWGFYGAVAFYIYMIFYGPICK